MAGGWTRTRNGRLKPRPAAAQEVFSIFANTKMPAMPDYYEPGSRLRAPSPPPRRQPGGPAKVPAHRQDTKVTWSATGKIAAGGNEIADGDPILQKLSDQVRQEYEKAFLFFLPRICEHCLNPSCVASCPSGAIYKREEDGIVLVDQDRCKGWRMCVTGCPYKKIYFNHRTGKAEKCTFCYPHSRSVSPPSATDVRRTAR